MTRFDGTGSRILGKSDVHGAFPRNPCGRRMVRSGLLAALLVLSTGCGFQGPLVRKVPEDEAASVRAGRSSVLLLRVAPRLDNVLVAPASRALASEKGLFLLQANIDRREKPRVQTAYSASAEAAGANWIHYLLSPGSYWVGAHDPGSLASGGATARFEFPPNDFFLEVPEGVPVVYGGTLQVSCTSKQGLFERLVDRCGDVSVSDESEVAGQVARRDFGELGPMETVLMRRSPGRADPLPVGGLFPMGVFLKNTPSLSTPEWRWRGVGRATGLGNFSSEDFRGSGGGTSYGGFAEAGFLIGYILYLPLGTAGGLIAGEDSAQKWGPCMDAIGTGVVGWSPREAFRAAVTEALAGRGFDNVAVVDDVSSAFGGEGRPRMKSLLELEVREVAFRECGKRWTFCGEMKVRARLRDLERNRTLYNAILLHSSRSGRSSFSPRMDRRPYERFAGKDPACRPIEEYCAPDGAKVFIGDLGVAVRALAEQLVEEGIGGSPTTSERGK